MSIIKWFDTYLEECFLVVLSSVMVVVIAAQVFMRYILTYSLPWSEELARYCFIWIVYIGISYGIKRQRHIKVDILLLVLKGKAKIVLHIIANLIFFAFACFVVIYGYDVAARLLQFGQTSPALNLPIGLVYLATPVGMALASVRIIQQLIIQFKALVGNGDFEVLTEHDIILEQMKSEDVPKQGIKNGQVNTK